MPIINVTSSASSKKEMEQLAKAIGNASDSVSSGSVFGKLNDIKNQFTQVWTPDKASKIDAAMTTRAPATTALSNTVWTNTRAAKVDNLDDKMTSRAPASTALTKTVWTDTRAKYLDKVNTNLDAAVSSRASANTALSNSVWTNARAAKVDNLDGKITSRAPATTALSNVVWTNARAAKVDNLDAKISTVNTTAANALNEAKAAKTAAVNAQNYAQRGIIKSIQRGVSYFWTSSDEISVSINEVNVEKSIVLINGSCNVQYYESRDHYFADPFLSEFTSTTLKFKLNLDAAHQVNLKEYISWQVIEFY